MKTLAILTSVKPEELLGNIENAIVFHHPVRLKIWISVLIFTFYIINQILLNYLQPNPFSYPYKM